MLFILPTPDEKILSSCFVSASPLRALETEFFYQLNAFVELELQYAQTNVEGK